MVRTAAGIFFLFIIGSCANRVAPTGGDKDVKPPTLLTAIPENKSTGFNAEEIVLTFDEYIQLKDISQQLIVSPLMDPLPSVTVKKRSVYIDLPDTLRPATTYTLNFGTAITDIHEGNTFPYQYIFSTGTVLDSLTFSGNAVDALKKSGTKGVKVMLYRDFSDSLPMKAKPDYFALTEENGDFTIYNISPGSYTAIALDDKNANYRNDSRQNEAISLPLTVTVPDSIKHNLVYFTEPPEELFIQNINSQGGKKWNINFNKPLIDPSVSQLNQSKGTLFTEWNNTNDTLYIWTTSSDSIALLIRSEDEGADTAMIRPVSSSKQATGRGAAKPPLIEMSNANSLTADTSLFLLFYNPALKIDTGRIVLSEDSIPVTFEYAITDSLKRRMMIRHKWKEDKSYRLTFMPGAVTDFSGIANDSLVLNFMLKNSRELGSVEINIKGLEEANYVLQLVSENKIVALKSIRGDGKYIFDKLDPGLLKARIIKDKNSNGRWDTGNYFKSQEPEPVSYYPGEIRSRGNWEVEINWIVASK